MGYDLRFDGEFIITPALPADRVGELAAHVAQTHPGSQRCCWRPLDDGRALVWDGCEKFSGYQAALVTLVNTFLVPFGHQLSGEVGWEGEDGATGRLRAEGATIVDEADEPGQALAAEVRSWIESLRNGSDEVRVVAARRIGCAVHGDAAVREAAIAALLDALAPPAVAKAALETLGAFGEDAGIGVAAVAPLLAHPDPHLRYWATFALARMGPRALVTLPALERLTKDPEPGPMYGSIDAIKRLSVHRSAG
jgi:hypothetical protein